MQFMRRKLRRKDDMATSVRADVVVIGAGIVGTFLAKKLIRNGKTVVLIDRGASALINQQPAFPPIECAAARHDGVSEARNHVLGGNGHYWGGGLLRPQSTKLGDMLGLKNQDDECLEEDLDEHFRIAEIDSGAPSPLRWREFPTQSRKTGPCSLVDYFLLTSKARNISMRALEELRKSNQCKLFTQADVLSFTRDSRNHISAVHIAQRESKIEISCSSVVLSAGTVDTLLMLQKHADSLGLTDAHDIGENLHDHIVAPIAMIENSADNPFMQKILPRFGRNGFTGRQLSLNDEDGKNGRGLLRFIPMLDEASPYKEIKHIFSLRQKGASFYLMAKTAAATMFKLPLLARIGYHRYVRNQLHISKELPVQALLIFESAENPQNRIRMETSQQAAIHWRINSVDEDTFVRLSERAYHLLDELSAKHGIKFTRPASLSTGEASRAYLHENSMDAFHLGGGLRYGRVIDHHLRLIATPNMHIVSTAVLQRPGQPNPTLTLLALAHRCAEHIAYPETQGVDAQAKRIFANCGMTTTPEQAPLTAAPSPPQAARRPSSAPPTRPTAPA